MREPFLKKRAIGLLLAAALGGLAVGQAAMAAGHGDMAAAPQEPTTAQATTDTKPEASANDGKLLVASLFILVLAGFVGFEVIRRVSPLLHTPLMSATNAISGISLVGSLVIAGSEEFSQKATGSTAARILGFVAVTTAMINVVGGFMITDRMLKMFRKKEPGRR